MVHTLKEECCWFYIHFHGSLMLWYEKMGMENCRILYDCIHFIVNKHHFIVNKHHFSCT